MLKLTITSLLLVVCLILIPVSVFAQEAPITLTLTVGCAETGSDSVLVPVGYNLVTDRNDITVISSRIGGDATQFVGYLPDGQSRTLFAGNYLNYFYVMFPINAGDWANFNWQDSVIWSVEYYDVSGTVKNVSVTIEANACGETDVTENTASNTPVNVTLPTVEIVTVKPKTCVVKYPELILVCGG